MEKYLLKPIIRLVIDERSGEINGTVLNCSDYNALTDSLVVYAYDDDTFD